MSVINGRMVVFLTSLGVSLDSYSAGFSLCAPDELIIASCQLEEAKSRTVSFCASADRAMVSYRFGLSTNVEINSVFFSDRTLSRWVDLATYTVYLGFRRGEYSYVFGVPQERSGAKSFLDVFKDNKAVMSAKCTDNSFGEKDVRSSAIKEVADEFVRGYGFVFPPNDIAEH